MPLYRYMQYAKHPLKFTSLCCGKRDKLERKLKGNSMGSEVWVLLNHNVLFGTVSWVQEGGNNDKVWSK